MAPFPRTNLKPTGHEQHLKWITRAGNDLVAEGLDHLIHVAARWLAMPEMVRKGHEGWSAGLDVQNAVVSLSRTMDRVSRLQWRCSNANAGKFLTLRDLFRDNEADQWPSSLAESHLQALQWFKVEMDDRLVLGRMLSKGKRLVHDRRTGIISVLSILEAATPAVAIEPTSVDDAALPAVTEEHIERMRSDHPKATARIRLLELMQGRTSLSFDEVAANVHDKKKYPTDSEKRRVTTEKAIRTNANRVTKWAEKRGYAIRFRTANMFVVLKTL